MQLRCKTCNKLLAIGSGKLQIKCGRCKTFNHYNTECRERQNCNPQQDSPATPR